MKQRLLTRIPLIVGFIFLIISARFLAWRLIPASEISHAITIPAGELSGSPESAPQSINHELELRVTYPSKIRAGEEATLRLDLIPETNIISRDEPFNNNPAIAAELSMINMSLSPQSTVSTAYSVDQPKSFTWELTAPDSGSRQGSLWVTMQFTPNEGSKVEVPLAVWEINLGIIRLWGMNSTQVTWLAMLALLIWGGMMVLGVKLEQTDRLG